MTLSFLPDLPGAGRSRIAKWRLDALLCSGVLLLCVLVAHPVAEIGMNDDFSYIKSAQILASTGHIVYNGWAAAMLGWQLYIGALFIKLFGDSFTAVRASTAFVAVVTVFVVQRIYVRLGANSWNATIGTLTLAACPLFLPLSASFMSDIDGLFCVVLCFYACIRSIQAITNGATLGWLIFAAVFGAVGGTVRQISWVGVFVLFPCTVWLLRLRPRVLLVGAVLYLASIAFVFASMIWFLRQPYAVGDGLLGRVNLSMLLHWLNESYGAALSLVFFLLPILAAFTIGLWSSRTPSHRWLAFGAVILGIGVAVVARLQHVYSLLAPFSSNYFTIYGTVAWPPILGERPVVLEPAARLAISACAYAALFNFVLSLVLWTFHSPRPAEDEPLKPCAEECSPSWRDLLIIMVPLALAYFTLLIPMGMRYAIFDRYLLPLLFLAIPICLRLYQERTGANLPIASLVVVLLFAVYSTAVTHDAFSLYRARLAAIKEMEAMGISATSIDAGFDFDAMTQIEETGYLNDRRILRPKPVFQPNSWVLLPDCPSIFLVETPVVRPRFALSFDPEACGGLSTFPSVSYRNWLGPHKVNIYVVRVSRDSGTSTGFDERKEPLILARDTT